MSGLGIKSALKRLFYTVQSAGERKRCTYASSVPEGCLHTCLPPCKVSSMVAPYRELLALWCQHILAHRFNILGSGWVQFGRDMGRASASGTYGGLTDACPDWLRDGVSPGNLKEAQRIWQLLSPEYSPIDWQLDVKSGYRWDGRTWFLLVPLRPQRGADIKVPWELGRMQHLPQLAIAHACAREGMVGFSAPEVYVQEFRNQVLDFIATNPPRYGVNWRCAMDVSIRVVNWLVAYDLFVTSGAVFDQPFLDIFVRSVWEHCTHVLHHLEWRPDYRNNHYLANIAGLLFCSVYLPCTPLTDAILAFAVQELVLEVARQFHEDGGHFEASVCYHRLSAEMVFYCTALILALPPDKQEALQSYDHTLVPRLKPSLSGIYPFPDWYVERLHRMARLTLQVTKPDGRVAQIGDNDSGRFLKLQPALRALPWVEARARFRHIAEAQSADKDDLYLYEDSLDHRHLLAFASGLFSDPDLSPFGATYPLEHWVATALCKRRLIATVNRWEEQVRFGDADVWLSCEREMERAHNRCILRIKSRSGDLRKALRLYGFPDFGVFIFRSSTLYLLVRCGSQKPGQRWGHAHNDQMHLELWVDGRDIVRDPGTFLYEASPEARNRYRSIHAHFTPAWRGEEPCRLENRVFEHRDCFKAECLYFGEKGIVVTHTGYGFPIYRIVNITDNEIICIDYTPARDKGSFTCAKYRLDFSPGYGECLNEPAVLEEAIEWTCS